MCCKAERGGAMRGGEKRSAAERCAAARGNVWRSVAKCGDEGAAKLGIKVADLSIQILLPGIFRSSRRSRREIYRYRR